MVDKKIVEYVARLARINVTEEEKSFLSSQLATILSYIDKLNELHVDGVEPLRSPHVDTNIFRNDERRISHAHADIMSNAPAREDNFFKIPRVIE